MRVDDIVTTDDGKKHRLISEVNGVLTVKCHEGKCRKAYHIKAERVVKRERVKR